MIIDRTQFGAPGPQVRAQRAQLNTRDDRVLALGMAHMTLEKSVAELRNEISDLKAAVTVMAQQVSAFAQVMSQPGDAPGVIDLNPPPQAADWPPVDDDTDE